MQKKIKLLSIIETLGRGGAERVLVNTLPELKKLGIDCEVAILFNIDDLAKELENKGIKVHRINLSHKWNIFEAILKLKKIYRLGKYDIVHAHLFFAHFYTALSLLFSKKIKKIVTFHNLGFNEYPANTFLKKVRKRVEEFCVKQFDKRTAVSKAVKEHYTEHLNLRQIDVIHNSFPLEEFEKYKIKSLKTNMFSVLTPGRLVPKKGHKYLIKAVKKLNQKNLKIKFYIVGSGPLENELKIQAKDINNIIFRNSIPHNELMQMYSSMDLIVIPSVYEAFGLVVGEAMIMQKPIVATMVDGIVDMIDNEKEGLLVPSKDSNALAEAVTRLYEDKALRDKLAKNAQKKIQSFDTKIIAQEWKTYYEGVLK